MIIRRNYADRDQIYFQVHVTKLSFGNNHETRPNMQLMEKKIAKMNLKIISVRGLNDAVPRLIGLVLRPRSDRLVPEVVSGI